MELGELRRRRQRRKHATSVAQKDTDAQRLQEVSGVLFKRPILRCLIERSRRSADMASAFVGKCSDVRLAANVVTSWVI